LSDDELKQIRPACRDLFLELERDMRGIPEGEYGMRKKVSILWTAHLKKKESDNLKKVAWDKILNTALAFLQSGLLIMLLTGGKTS
jgi:hypothetical protein